MKEPRLTNNQLVVLFAFALAALAGLVEGILQLDGSIPRPLEVAELLLVNFIVFCWFVRDTSLYNYRRSGAMMFCVAAFGIFTIAYYLLRTRGFKNGLKGIALALILIFVSLCIYGLTWLATYSLAT